MKIILGLLFLSSVSVFATETCPKLAGQFQLIGAKDENQKLIIEQDADTKISFDNGWNYSTLRPGTSPITISSSSGVYEIVQSSVCDGNVLRVYETFYGGSLLHTDTTKFFLDRNSDLTIQHVSMNAKGEESKSEYTLKRLNP